MSERSAGVHEPRRQSDARLSSARLVPVGDGQPRRPVAADALQSLRRRQNAADARRQTRRHVHRRGPAVRRPCRRQLHLHRARAR